MITIWNELVIKCGQWQQDTKAEKRSTTHKMSAEVVQSTPHHRLPWNSGKTIEIRVDMQLEDKVAKTLIPGSYIRLAVADSDGLRAYAAPKKTPYLILRSGPRDKTPNPCELWSERHRQKQEKEQLPPTSTPIEAMEDVIKRLQRLSNEEYAGGSIHAYVLSQCQEWLTRNIEKRKACAIDKYDKQVAAHMNKFDDPEEAWRSPIDGDI